MTSNTVARGESAALPPEENRLSERYLRIAERWIPVGLEYFEEWPERENCGHFLGGCHWYGQETLAGSLTFAAAASSPSYDETVGGCSRSSSVADARGGRSRHGELVAHELASVEGARGGI